MPGTSDPSYRADLIFHGHFYQPPRENPWTDEVETERSARPFHDWNARITAECYRPNAFARIADDQGRIEEILNGYERMSFDFGPTLLRWLERHDPVTLRRIVDADRASCERLDGHGNAIAHAYNHIILPLANPRDRRTQIRWGITEFRHRFRRAPEAMWLPETAANEEVLDELIEFGMRYAILSPRQARRVRPGPKAPWVEVNEGRVDPSRPYRYRSRRNPSRSFALFFYDGPLAHRVSFGGALKESQAFLDAVEGAGDARRRHQQLLHVAVDGETAGHHTAWGDRALNYALARAAHSRGLRVTNYGAFLAQHPPRWEVELELGPRGEGSAWSCAHGVGRWIRDCGCRVGSEEGWNQAWRTPLRAALDLLRDRAVEFFDDEATPLLRDPWAARDDYVELLLHPGSEHRAAFLDRHARGGADAGRALGLLEMQHHLLLMYTSCGWFFDDIAGLEAVQILRYAARAMDLWDELGGQAPHEDFEARLAEARSNRPEEGTGADVFRRRAATARVSPRRVAAHLAMRAVEEIPPEVGQLALHEYRRDGIRVQRREHETLVTGSFSLEHQRTLRRCELGVAMLHRGGLRFAASVEPLDDPRAFESFQQELHDRLASGDGDGLDARLAQRGEGRILTARDLLEPGRQSLLETASAELLARFGRLHQELYEEHRAELDALSGMGMSLPDELRRAAELALRARFEREFLEHARSHDAAEHARAIALVREALERDLGLDTSLARRHLGWMLEEAVSRLAGSEDGDRVAEAAAVRELLELARRLQLRLDLDQAQETLYGALQAPPPLPAPLREAALALGFSPRLWAARGSVP